MTSLSKVARRGLIALASMVTLVILIVAGVHLGFVRARVLDWLEARVSRDLGVDVHAEELGYNLFSPSAELRNVRLSIPGDRPFLQANAARIAVARSVFRGVLEPQRLELDHASITIVRHRDGSTNVPAGRKPASKPTPIHLGIVRLEALSIDVEDEATGHRVAAGPLTLALDTRAGAASSGDLGTAPITVRIGPVDDGVPPRELTGTLAGDVAFDGARLTAHNVRLEAPEGRLTLDGWIDILAETMRADARARLEANLARAARLAGPSAAALAGSATADVTLSGAIDDPAVRAAIVGRSVRFQSMPELDLIASATYAAGRVGVERLGVTSDLAEIDATGTVDFGAAGRPTQESRLSGRIARADLDRALAAADIQLPVQVGSTAAGQVDIALDGGTPLDIDAWRHMRVDGSIGLAPSGAGLSVGGKVHLVMNGGLWRVAHSLRAPAGHTTLDGALSGDVRQVAVATSTLSGSTHLEVQEVQGLLPLLTHLGVNLPEPIDRVEGGLDATIDPRGTFEAPVIQATVSARRIRMPAITDEGELESTLTVDRRALTAKSLDARLGQTRLTGSGAYRWSGQIDAAFEATAGDLRTLAAAFDLNDVSAIGSTELKGSLRGSAQSPQGDAELTARDLSAYGVAIGTVTARLRLDKDYVDVEADAPNLNLDLKGGLQTRAPFGFQADVGLDRSPVAALLPPQRTDVPVEGTITASVRATGAAERLSEIAGDIDLRGFDLKVAGVPLVLDTPARVSVEPDAISATSLQLRVGQETSLRLQGSLGTKAVRDGIDVRLNGTVADLLDVATPAMPEKLPIETDRSRVSLDLHVGGTLAAPAPAGRLTVDAGSLRYGDFPPLTNLALNAQIEPARIALETLTAEWQGAKLAAEGAVPVRMIAPAPRAGAAGLASFGSTWLSSLPAEPRSAAFSARATLTADALAPFVDPVRLQRISGTVDLSASAEADAFSLDALQASIVVDRAALDLAGVPVTQVVPTRVRLERGRARLDALRLNAQGNELTASGGLDLFGATPAIDLVVNGAIDLRMLGAFAGGFASGGIAHTAFTVEGPLAAPELVGNVYVSAGDVRIDTPGVSASDFNGSIGVDAGRKATVDLGGFVNGGWTDIKGNLDLQDLASPLGGVNLTAYNVMLEYPEGFQTDSNVDLVLTFAPSASTLSGRIDVVSGVYREPIVLSRTLLSGFGRSTPPAVRTDSSFLDTLRLDVTVATANEIRVDNNYGRLSVSANLSVTGSAARPGAIGRLEAEPDGEVYLAGNTYRIETLVIDLTNPRTVAPEVTFLANTRVGNTPIEIALQCSASGPCEREVRSQAAGVTNEQAEAMLFGISTDPNEAGAQLARLLSGELLGVVSSTVGLDTLRLEQTAGERSDLFDDPTLVAGDVNPASRLTIGKRLGDHVELAYSQDLADNGFVMSTTYFAPAGISLRALLLDNQDRSYEFRHEPRFGGRRPTRAAPPQAGIVTAIQFTGNPGFDEKELRAQLNLKEGDRFEFARWQQDRERLNRFYDARGYFEARVRARRSLPTSRSEPPSPESSPEAVTLEYSIERGKPTRLDVTGFDLPEEVRRRIVERWTSAIFDGFLERDVALIVREHLYLQGRMQAAVHPHVVDTDEGKTLRVEIDSGPAMNRRLEFEGNVSVPTATLLEVAQGAGPLAGWLDPAPLARAIERRYEEIGFLSADVEIRGPDVETETSVVRVVVREGEAWQIGGVTLGGAEQVMTSVSDLRLTTGSRYDPAVIAGRITDLEQRFRDGGFLDVRVVSETVLDQGARRVDVHVLVQPGPRRTLASVTVEGADADNPGIRQSLGIGVGEPVSASALSGARRRLYETGTYRSVEIALEPTGAAPPEGAATGDVPAVVRVRVEERPRYSFRYGLSVNSDAVGPDERDTRLGFAADLENHDLFGRRITVGLSARLRRDQEVGRVYLGATRFWGLPLRSNVFLSRARQDIGSADTARTVSDVTEISAEQIYRLRRFVDLHYGYGFGKNRTTLTDSNFDLAVRVARLTTSGVVDKRSDPFDPARGWFTSASLELSRPGLGSELSFLRSFTQLYYFAPMRGGMVLASAARLGVAPTFRGETLIPSERFFAGGATSVRGYRENDLGPRSIFGDANGGPALFIANGELRFPVFRRIRGVGFVDLGDVYPTIGDLLMSGVQVGTGGGIRLNTPVGLLRLDLALPVNPRPDDPRWRIHFGLGHAF